MATPKGPRHARSVSTEARPAVGMPWRTPGTGPRHAREQPALPMPESFSMPVVVEEYYLFGKPGARTSMSALSKRVASFIVEAQTDDSEGVSSYGFNVVDGRVAIYGLDKHSDGSYTMTGERVALNQNTEVQVETREEHPHSVMQFSLGERTMTLFAEQGSALRVLAPDEFFIQPSTDQE